ncbi:MAG: diguanylate cyclase [Deltaproteobacteria bacterium]|nr:diguanylate cyclase [Deltaproteobacteria bacterium]
MLRHSLAIKLGIATGLVALALIALGMAVLWPLPDSEVRGLLGDELRVTLFVLVVVIGGVMAVVALLARQLVTRPLLNLARDMSRAEEGDFLVRAPTRRRDEIGELAKAFNKMLAAITDLHATGIDREQDLQRAQQALEMQQELERRSHLIEEANTQLKGRIDELTLLMDLTRAATSTLELSAVLDEIAHRVGKAMGVDEFAILLLDRARRRLQVVSTFGAPNSAELMALTFALGEGICGRVAQTGRPLLVPDTSTDARYLHAKGLRQVDGSFLALPMVAKGRVLGVLNFFRVRRDGFDNHAVALLNAVAGQAALAIENARLFQEQAALALTDALTGLLNRRALDQRLDEEFHRARRFGSKLALLMIDVDHFKEFNDKHGHLLGDHVLKQVARTLRRQLRKGDVLARYGGEEFCAILVRTQLDQAVEAADKLRRAVAERTYARVRSDRRLKITISAGVAELQESHSGPTELLDAADSALYLAKNAGRNCVRVAEPAKTS